MKKCMIAGNSRLAKDFDKLVEGMRVISHKGGRRSLYCGRMGYVITGYTKTKQIPVAAYTTDRDEAFNLHAVL